MGWRARSAGGAAALLLSAAPLAAGDLAQEVGRSEVRVYSAGFAPRPGLSVQDADLAGRLERQGYRRVRRKPERPGEFFWGHDVFWIYRRAHRRASGPVAAVLFGLSLERSTGRITSLPDGVDARLEPELLAESLAGDRAPREPVSLDELPEHLWRAVLAAEDARFFEHSGVDARALARAMLSNLKAGKVVQGGSTITQQLIKNRDLTPKRKLGRKVSEAVRALALEAEHDKREILEAYLDSVYLGHVGGLGVYGVGAAARAWFGKPAGRLGLGESALLAAMIQGPNRLHPGRHPRAARERQRWVLSRLEELGWASAGAVAAARRAGLPRLVDRSPPAPPARQFLAWVRQTVEERAAARLEKGRGLLVETTLDPHLQAAAEQAVAAALRRLGRRTPHGAALVSLDAATGDVVAYVGGDPRDPGDRFDRARQARRQTGSAVKPLVVLEAFSDCGERAPLFASRRVRDAPLEIALPSGPWRPENPSGRFAGTVDLRRSLVESLNTPFVRVARWCGFQAVAARFAAAGLELPPAPPPAFVLGAVETTPLAMAAAFTAFGRPGRVAVPRPWSRLRRASGRGLASWRPDTRRLADRASSWLVRDLLRDAVANGTGRPAQLDGVSAWGKTGTSSGGRDGWFVGGAGGLVTAVWLGVERGAGGGLSGAADAAPLWREFMQRAVGSYPAPEPARPNGVVYRWVDEASGMLVRGERRGARREAYRRGYLPPRRKLLGGGRPLPPID